MVNKGWEVVTGSVVVTGTAVGTGVTTGGAWELVHPEKRTPARISKQMIMYFIWVMFVDRDILLFIYAWHRVPGNFP
jgi:hypothetical protein